jgi:hypothetical protein
MLLSGTLYGIYAQSDIVFSQDEVTGISLLGSEFTYSSPKPFHRMH